MKSNPKELALWLQKGNEDLDVARLIQQKKKVYWAACFHAQQAAEKFLKAFLVSVNMPPPKTHDLVDIAKRCAKHEPSFTFLMDFCVRLIPYSVQARYVDEIVISAADARKAIKAAEEIRTFVLNKVG